MACLKGKVKVSLNHIRTCLVKDCPDCTIAWRDYLFWPGCYCKDCFDPTPGWCYII